MEEPSVEVRRSGVNIRVSILGVIGASLALGGTVVGLTTAFTDIRATISSHGKRITDLEDVTDASMLERLKEVEVIFDGLPALRERLSLIERDAHGLRYAVEYFHFPDRYQEHSPPPWVLDDGLATNGISSGPLREGASDADRGD